MCCFVFALPLFHVTKMAGWAALVAQETTIVLTMNLNLSAPGIRRELRRYFEEEAKSNPNMINKSDFLSRYVLVKSDLVKKLVERIYDQFEEEQLNLMLGWDLRV